MALDALAGYRSFLSQAAWCGPGCGFDDETVKRWLKWLASLAFLISMSLGMYDSFEFLLYTLVEKSVSNTWAGNLASI